MNMVKILLFALCLCTANSRSSALNKSAEEILDETGLKGGLVVHLGCSDGRLTTELHNSSSFVVLGLDTDMQNVDSARRYIQSRGLYGQVTAELLVGSELPLIDNVVNLLVADSETGVENGEIERVLVPGGVAFVNGRKTVKPIPEEADEWTHYLHSPDNNAVSRDKIVSYPYHMQWAGLPVWTRNHNYLNSYSALVSAGGRIFYILDEGPTQSVKYKPKWTLVARNAYNGIVLWKKDIGKWEGNLRRFRSGPVELPRRLVASGDRLYATMGYMSALSILDGATGEVIHTATGTEGTHEIICSDDVLYLVAGEIDSEKYEASLETRGASPQIRRKRIIAVSTDTGRKIWEVSNEDTHEILPTTLCAGKARLFYQSPDSLLCLEKKSGKVLWKTPRQVERNRMAWSSPTLVVFDDVVLCADGKFASKKKKERRGAPTKIESNSSRINWTISASPSSAAGGELVAFRAKDGKELWRCPAALGYSSPPNLFVANGLVWVSEVPGINVTDMTEGRDLHTGKVIKTIDTAKAFEAAHHHRCYRDKATDRFLLLGRTGVEFVDIQNNDIQRHYWIRGTCQYGIMPANGLLYMPGHSCGCYIQSKLNGFWAIAPKRKGKSGSRQGARASRLIRGEAYGEDAVIAGLGGKEAESWPMHRHDNERTSSVETKVPKDLEKIWSTDLGERITSPVIADGRVIVALKDSHIVTSLDASNGNRAWSFTAGGRIDSPPTISKGLVAFGSHDGYVYCLRLTDGKMVWRFRAAPEDKQTMAFGQLESVWPVVGSVSIVEDTLYCVAGRSSYLDNGMTLNRLDLATGAEKGKTELYSRDPETGEQPDALLEDVELPGALPDILTFEGGSMFLRDKQFNLEGEEQIGKYRPHLYSSAGLLDPNWWHRTIWIWGKRAFGRASGWAIAGRYNPSGRLLVLDDSRVYGYKFADRARSGKNHTLFCADKAVERVNKKLKNNNTAIIEHVTPDKVVYHWSVSTDFAVRGMVKAGDIIFAAGPNNAEEIHFDYSSTGSTLAAFSAKSGDILSQLKIDRQPVFDGMAAADQCIYMSLTSESVVCYGAKRARSDLD